VTLDQNRARVFGVLYLITFITSIPALLLNQPVLDDPVGYISSAGQDNRIVFGALLVLLLIMFGVADAGGTLQASRRLQRACGSCRSASTARRRASGRRPRSFEATPARNA
jgi:hypothetical protein